WVTRAPDVRAYWDGGTFTGWTVGLGGILLLRLYLKSHEIETRSHKFFLHDLWKQRGWAPGTPVWRAEGQFRREVLSELQISSVEELLERLPGLWAYLTQEWVRYAVPVADDQTRGRWPTHSVWEALSKVPWEGSAEHLARVRPHSRVPSEAYYGR